MWMILAVVAICLTLQAVYTRYHGGLAAIPGPFSASFCNYWRIISVYKSDMPRRNIEVHKRYGPVVRIGPKHVSFGTPEGLATIHGSRQAYAKSDWYKPTATQWEGKPLLNLFAVQDTSWHSGFKKTVAGLYTKAAVVHMESKINGCMIKFMEKLQQLSNNGKDSLDMALWVHLFTFDCLGELNFSKEFGFVEKGRDFNGLIGGSDAIIVKTGFNGIVNHTEGSQTVATTMKNRLESPTASPDMLNSFLKLQEQNPDRLTLRDIQGSMYINLMAGHDVLAVTLRAILYFVARSPEVRMKIDQELAPLNDKYPTPELIPYEELMNLPYMDAVIHEALRIHANLGLINERVVPPEGAVINGYSLPGGTIVGVNPWVMHRNTEIFGEDVESFRPERWLPDSKYDVEKMRRNMFSFGAGPRMCIGKNIAMMQIFKFVAEFYRRFDAELTYPEREWRVVGNWVTKQSDVDMLLTARS